MKKTYGKILLIVLPILAAAWLLYPTYRAYELEKQKTKALLDAKSKNNTADSLTVMEEFDKLYGEDLEKAKSERLKLGLDLRGGMYVTLEVDVVKLIEESADQESIDDLFTSIIEATGNEAKLSDEPVIEIFLRKFNDIARPKGKTLISYFDIIDFKDASEDKIIEKLNENASGAIDQAIEVIRQRVDKYGVSEPTIQKQGNRRILLELPGVNDEEEMRKLLQTTARLEFHLVKNNSDIARAFWKIDKFLYEQKLRRQGKLTDEPIEEPATGDSSISQQNTNNGTTPSDTNKLAMADSINKSSDSANVKDTDSTDPYKGLSEDQARKKYKNEHPFTSLFDTYYQQDPKQRSVPVSFTMKSANLLPEGEYSFFIPEENLERYNGYLLRSEVRSLIPIDLKLAREANPDQRILKESEQKIFSIFCLKKEPELTGDVITDAYESFDQTSNQPIVIMQMNSDGSEKWARITGANVNKRIAIVLDEQVYSAPNVIDKIVGGNSQITGMANIEEARLLKIVLKAGALKAPVQIVEERVVGPSLGEDSIKSGFMSGIIAIGLVFLFMLVYYVRAGFVANIAVILNVTLVIAVLAAFGGTLTLPGIAGIILTVGMAVDANILIFERVRDELSKGRSLRSAVDEGFSKALSAILDSNITTGITAIILYYLGSGPIQGFALTLLIGIFGTLFTGILVSRAIVEISLINGATTYNFGQPKAIQV